MATKPYDEILQRAQSELSVEEQKLLCTELEEYATRKNGNARGITGLRGLGKDIWEGIDPDEYVAEERKTWGG